MRHTRWFPLILLALAFQSTFGYADESKESVLTWNNDDALSGELVGYQDGYLKWKTPLFDETLEVDANYIASVDFQEDGSTPESDGRAGFPR